MHKVFITHYQSLFTNVLHNIIPQISIWKSLCIYISLTPCANCPSCLLHLFYNCIYPLQLMGKLHSDNNRFTGVYSLGTTRFETGRTNLNTHFEHSLITQTLILVAKCFQLQNVLLRCALINAPPNFSFYSSTIREIRKWGHTGSPLWDTIAKTVVTSTLEFPWIIDSL